MKPYPFMTHPVGLAARRVARRIGLVRLIAPLLRTPVYEEAFSNALLDEIKPGDRVWDVGANVGYYTKLISERVGETGKVIAFEPSPRSVEKLESLSTRSNVVIYRAGLGPTPGEMAFEISDDETGVTDKIVVDRSRARNTITVEVLRGDDVVAGDPAMAPNVVKIDVEGFEFDVLQGMSRATRSPALRALFIEVHFGVLEARGKPNAPRDIEAMLRAAGFNVSWLDHSHLVARRAS